MIEDSGLKIVIIFDFEVDVRRVVILLFKIRIARDSLGGCRGAGHNEASPNQAKRGIGQRVTLDLSCPYLVPGNLCLEACHASNEVELYKKVVERIWKGDRDEAAHALQ